LEVARHHICPKLRLHAHMFADPTGWRIPARCAS
jgi:hypothetical protein